MNDSSAGCWHEPRRGTWNLAQGCIWCLLDYFKRPHFSTLWLSIPLPPVLAVITGRTTSSVVDLMQKSPVFITMKKKVIFYWRKSYCYLKVCDSRWKVEKSLLRGVKKPSSVRNRWISAALSPSSCLSGAADVKFCTKFPFLVWTKDIEIYRDDLYTGTLLRIHFWGLRRNWRLFHLFNKA